MTGSSGREAIAASQRVVVKLGTTVVARPDGRLAVGRVGALAEQVDALVSAGRQVVLVSSGAVGLGAERLGMSRPTRVVDRQACAAVGQGVLLAFYDALFARLGRRVAQVLLTEEDFHRRRRHVHLSATLERLLDLGVVPVVNENDTVSTAELALRGPTVFGDNDRLSALVAAGTGADLLVLLSDVEGVFDRPPGEPGSQRIGRWSDQVAVTFGAPSAQGRGGMEAKIASAERAAAAGVHAVIAGGRVPEVLGRVVAGEDVGTWFPARGGWSRKRSWLALASVPSGRLVVDGGARQALVRGRASLLAPGILKVEGAFEEGDVVSLVGPDEVEFGRGRVSRSAPEVQAMVGAPQGRSRAVVHRDHVVVFDEVVDESGADPLG